jgi:hypothetical protein
MKSFGGLWGRITAPENLLAAWVRVRKGHGGSQAVQEYAAHLDANLEALRADVLSGTYHPGAYQQFRVHDPKPRTISCAPVRDRVLHHALCGVITPRLEWSFTEDSYACQEGKGTHRACRRARDLVGAHPWYCKFDVRHYFDSIVRLLQNPHAAREDARPPWVSAPVCLIVGGRASSRAVSFREFCKRLSCMTACSACCCRASANAKSAT